MTSIFCLLWSTDDSGREVGRNPAVGLMTRSGLRSRRCEGDALGAMKKTRKGRRCVGSVWIKCAGQLDRWSSI